MNISYNWLKTIIDIDLPADEVSKLLTDTGLEVEGIEQVHSIPGGLEGIVIGEVIEKEKHENADKLNVTKVKVSAAETLQIVCGAPNVDKGQKVLVATVGSTLYPSPEESFEIKKAKIRGVESFGMICSEVELGLGDDHDGIMVLPNDAQVGQPAAEHFNISSDTVFEIGLTPNRTDALGHFGVARDLKAAINVLNNGKASLKIPASYEGDINQHNSFKLSVENTEKCPYYSGVIIKDINSLETPEWMVNALNSIGQKSINAIVDITNYVLFETGQPLHAFDLEHVKDEIIVRTATNKEKFVTLDETERELDNNDLVIANGNEPMCIAGVFGGLDSGVSESTKSIFLEAAYFNPVTVRKTAKRHGLSTDSSFRFERGVDPQNVDYAMRRALHLILEISGGTLEGQVTTGEIADALKIEVHFDQIRKIIGYEIPEETIAKILDELEFEVVSDSEESWVVKVPTYRVDVTREIDVIEEILRIYGFNNIPLPEKLNSSITLRPNPDKEKLYNRAANFLADNGFAEIMNNSLTRYDNADKAVELLNPLSRELKHMRMELLSGGLASISHNQNRQFPDLKLFEFGKVYMFVNNHYVENEVIGIWQTGVVEEENWSSRKEKADLYDLKGTIEALCEKLGIGSPKYSEPNEEGSITVKTGKINLGSLSTVSKKMLKQHGVKNPVYYAELNWKKLIECANKSITQYKALPKTQFVRRDFSLLLDESVNFSEIRKIAKSTDSVILKKVGLFDVYEGKNLDKGKKSYAVSFYFQDHENTLQDEQVDSIMSGIRGKLEKDLGAVLR